MRYAINYNLIKNFLYLALIEGTAVLVPIIIYPYVLSIFGVSSVGNIVFYQAIVAYVIVVVQFGFSISATREVVLKYNDNIKLSSLFVSVFIIKMILFILAVLITLCFELIVSSELDSIFYILMTLAFSEVFNLLWFYQGLDRIRLFSISIAMSRIVTLILVFMFIRTNEQINTYALFLVAPNLFVNIVIFTYTIYKVKIKVIFNRKETIKMFREGFGLFMSRASSVFSAKGAMVFLGIMDSSGRAVAYFDLANRLVGLVQLPFNLFNRVYYPTAVKEKNYSNSMAVIGWVFALSIIVCVVVTFWVGDLILLYTGNNDMTYSALVFYVLVATVPINVISHNVGNCILIVYGRIRMFNNSVYLSTLMFIMLLLIFYLNKIENLILVAVAIVAFALVVMVMRVFEVYRVISDVKCIEKV
ncbi:putative O-antigen transporter [Vibrio scophthalmi]|uniref:Putative O-antigen transporter n=2 Tax=Vibrio scophthalmi TaxID=45658 RepID=A0A1E3WJI8_9VIBR|nr:putative O-antigen transporter [Vibrio scophthalmi]